MKDEVRNVLRLANLVRENIRAKQLFTPYNSILVTLSGGQDSLCSLVLLYLLQNQLGLDRHARTKPTVTLNFNSIEETPKVRAARIVHRHDLAALELELRLALRIPFVLPALLGRASNARAKALAKNESLATLQPRAPVRKAQVTVVIAKVTRFGGATTLFERAESPFGVGTPCSAKLSSPPSGGYRQLPVKHVQPERFSSVLLEAPRQLNESVRVARFTAVRGPIFCDRRLKHKVDSFQSSIPCEYCSVKKKKTSKLEPHNYFVPSLLMASFAEPLTEDASSRTKKWDDAISNRSLVSKNTFKKTKTSVNSAVCSTTTDKILFYSAERSFCLAFSALSTTTGFANLCSRLQSTQTFDFSESLCSCVACSAKQSRQYKRDTQSKLTRSNEARVKVRGMRLKKYSPVIGEFGVFWCNHFWQRESFYTMLHVAKINLCFSSTMCFYLPIESVLSEQNAREWRHKSIQRTCAFYRYDCCAQGHTKSDRVETILFNILRGTGIAGLQSLQWKKNFYSFSCQKFYPCPYLPSEGKGKHLRLLR